MMPCAWMCASPASSCRTTCARVPRSSEQRAGDGAAGRGGLRARWGAAPHLPRVRFRHWALVQGLPQRARAELHLDVEHLQPAARRGLPCGAHALPQFSVRPRQPCRRRPRPLTQRRVRMGVTCWHLGHAIAVAGAAAAAAAEPAQRRACLVSRRCVAAAASGAEQRRGRALQGRLDDVRQAGRAAGRGAAPRDAQQRRGRGRAALGRLGQPVARLRAL